MITTNVPWLEAELLEESKFFSSVTEKTIITHSSREENGFFLNEITVNGKAYGYADRHEYNGELEHKRYLRRYAKLALFLALTDFTGEKSEWVRSPA